MVALTMRNYRRKMGILLSTRWELKQMEMGVFEKEYDQTTGEYFFEKKIIQINPQSVLDTQWIQERINEKEYGMQTQHIEAEEREQAQDKNIES